MSEAPAMCPNCSHQKVARFCAYCGQNHRDYRRSLPPMLMELVREAFELDGRIVQSLRLLFAQPGQLSVEFSQNRRAAYVSPIRFYLFASILFFFVLTQVADITPELNNGPATVPGEASATADAEHLEQLYALLTPDQVRRAQELLAREGSFARAAVIGLADNAYESAQRGEEIDDVERFLYGQLIEVFNDPQEFIDRSIENAPFSMFVLLPVYALLLKILYWRRHKYYVEHLVYALHLHTFLFLLITAQISLPASVPGFVDALIFAVAFGYTFMSLRRFYAQGYVKTTLKLGFLLLAYSVLLGPSILATILLTASQL